MSLSYVCSVVGNDPYSTLCSVVGNGPSGISLSYLYSVEGNMLSVLSLSYLCSVVGNGPYSTCALFLGNGPSGISLSYLLSGNWPYYKGGCQDEMLDARLTSQPNLSLLEQDLEFLSDVRDREKDADR
jgi:hypothetical protein